MLQPRLGRGFQIRAYLNLQKFSDAAAKPFQEQVR